MIISPASLNIGQGVPVQFEVSGGTAPYVFSIALGPGAISADGLFSSRKSGVTRIQVQDSLGLKVLARVAVNEPMQLIVDILRRAMELDANHCYIFDQNIPEPKDKGAFIVISVLNSKVFGNVRRYDDVGNEIQDIFIQDNLSIDIKSGGPDARQRKEEILMSLNSTYSEQQQERNSFRVYPLSNNFVNLSVEDGAAIPYRFNVGVALQYKVTKTTAADYFDTFSDAIVFTNL